MPTEEQRVTELWLASMATGASTASVTHQVPSTKAVCKNPLSTARWEEYGWSTESLSTYGVKDISAESASDMGFTQCTDGIYITYPRDEDSRIRWVRSGFGLQTVAGKYGQRHGTLPALYYPPTQLNWQKNPSLPILITEGEFKAIAVDIIVNTDRPTTIVPCAVGGVFSWQSNKRGVDLIPDMKEIAWAGRQVYLAFDTDLSTNPMVALALQRLTNKLAEQGAEIRVLQWPGSLGKGIDDYLCGQTLSRDAWLSLLETSQFPTHVTAVIELNARYTYCEIQQQVYDATNCTYIPPRSFSSDFFTRLVKIQTGVKNGKPAFKDMSIGQYWLTSPMRSTCVEPIFTPGRPRVIEHGGRTYLNTWLGWGQGLRNTPLAPVKGDVQPFYDFLNATFASEGQANVTYLLKRIAWMFQQPEKKHPTWLYLMGAPLQGKSTLIKIISSLVGEKYTANVDEGIVKGAFAEWRAEKLLVTFDDSSITDPRVIRQLLKRLTTESHSQVNLKYVKAQTTESYFSFIFATNSVDPLLDHDDRRALVLEADCKWDFAKGEWKEFDTWRSTKASMQALLFHLLYEVKLEAEFYNEVPPKTGARELVVEVGESTWDDTINYFAMSKGYIQWDLPASDKVRKWKPTIFTIDMIRQVFLLRNGDLEKFKITSATLVGKLVRYGARRVDMQDGTDNRKRILIGDKQVSFWTWDRLWVHMDRGHVIDEYAAIRKELPELFPIGTAKY